MLVKFLVVLLTFACYGSSSKRITTTITTQRQRWRLPSRLAFVTTTRTSPSLQKTTKYWQEHKNQHPSPTVSFLMKSSSSLMSTTTTSSNEIIDTTKNLIGLYRPFVNHAWETLQKSGLFVLPTDDDSSLIPTDLSFNTSPAKGMPNGSIVRMETSAMIPPAETDDNKSTLRYARYALLETLVPKNTTSEGEETSNNNSTNGIQVMNLVVFPSFDTSLPVWGVDLVSLPGGRHLLAMDVQPMVSSEQEEKESNNDNNIDLLTEKYFKPWYDTNVKDIYEWGGDIPDDASNYFSQYALWTRFKEGTDEENDNGPISIIQTSIYDVFCKHLDLYISMIKEYADANSSSDESSNASSDSNNNNAQKQYIQYRLKNDPARPMLQSLYGAEWTERVLEEILFPIN